LDHNFQGNCAKVGDEGEEKRGTGESPILSPVDDQTYADPYEGGKLEKPDWINIQTASRFLRSFTCHSSVL
jgi:hypothetical protein